MSDTEHSWDNWTQSLDSLLEDETGSELFGDYLESQGGSVQLNFIYAVDGLKLTSDKDGELSNIRGLIHSILGLSQTLIGLTDSTRQYLKELFDKSTKNLNLTSTNVNIFDSVVQEVRSHLERTFYPKFFKSDIYVNYITKCESDSTVSRDEKCSSPITSSVNANAIRKNIQREAEAVPEFDLALGLKQIVEASEPKSDLNSTPPLAYHVQLQNDGLPIPNILPGYWTHPKNDMDQLVNIQVSKRREKFMRRELNGRVEFDRTVVEKLDKVAEGRPQVQVPVESFQEIQESLEADQILDAHLEYTFDDRTGEADSPPQSKRRHRCRCRKCNHSRHHLSGSHDLGMTEDPYGGSSSSLRQNRGLDLSARSLSTPSIDSGVYSGASVVSSGVGSSSQVSSSSRPTKPGTSWTVLGDF